MAVLGTVEPEMKKSVIISIFAGLVLAGLGVALSGIFKQDPKDLSHWMRVAGEKDWSTEAAENKPQAQFSLGLILIRTNLMTFIDRVPMLSAVPIVGKRFFEQIAYGIDNNAGQEQLREAYQWIKKSADQGYAPAKEAEKLFIGRVGVPNQSAEPTRSSGERPKRK